MKLTYTKRTVLASACIALCLVLPMAFHSFPNGGNIFLPMHLPVLLCGLMCGWPYGLVCGIMGPVLSSLLTAMPPAAILPSMAVECAAYGCVSGVMMLFVRTKHTTADLYISLLSAMLAGRLLSGLVKGLLLAPGTPLFAWVTTSLITGLPGVGLQLVLLPPLVLTLTRAKLLPRRYPQ